ncbi:Mitochondrial ornithine transporter 1 [Schistosoma japonicum]|uniref:Mitochondrial ornithine transporter 1 n=1 Tax=Schistosoma japonicum TaxID=6182 RepID=C1LDZ5_SCHJA|nr:Mitochondrial ornithine transporter 1 [Schistosoma japonicum]CAX72923.1 Mitochondrial ornithine transporter 1 [Schistosoma japonicum]
MEQVKNSLIGFAAGVNGGFASVYVGQPLDTIKVKMQTFPEVYPSTLKCLRVTLTKDGIARGLYAGTVPSLIANVAENAVLFCALPPSEHLIANLCGVKDSNLSVLQHGFAGSLAAFWSSLVLCPTELVKCKVQSMREMMELGHVKSDKKHFGPWSVTKSIFKEKGFKGFTCGLSATFAREMPGYFFFFGGYEAFRTLMTPTNGRKDDLGSIKTIIAGGMGGVSLWVAIFPFDVVKSRMQIGHHSVTSSSVAHGNEVNKQRSMFSVLLDIKNKEGIRALYRGLGPTILRTFPATGALFLAVEWTRKCCHWLLD